MTGKLGLVIMSDTPSNLPIDFTNVVFPTPIAPYSAKTRASGCLFNRDRPTSVSPSMRSTVYSFSLIIYTFLFTKPNLIYAYLSGQMQVSKTAGKAFCFKAFDTKQMARRMYTCNITGYNTTLASSKQMGSTSHPLKRLHAEKCFYNSSHNNCNCLDKQRSDLPVQK